MKDSLEVGWNLHFSQVLALCHIVVDLLFDFFPKGKEFVFLFLLYQTKEKGWMRDSLIHFPPECASLAWVTPSRPLYCEMSVPLNHECLGMRVKTC